MESLSSPFKWGGGGVLRRRRGQDDTSTVVALSIFSPNCTAQLPACAYTPEACEKMRPTPNASSGADKVVASSRVQVPTTASGRTPHLRLLHASTGGLSSNSTAASIRRASVRCRRDRFLKSAGFRVLRFWNNEVIARPEDVLETIFAALARTLDPSAPVRAPPHLNGEAVISLLLPIQMGRCPQSGRRGHKRCDRASRSPRTIL